MEQLNTRRAIGEEIVPGGLTGRALTWTVRGVGSVASFFFAYIFLFLNEALRVPSYLGLLPT